jgi:membrane AbrB-like protein
MPPPYPPRLDLLCVSETLLIAAAGGVLFAALGLPAGLVSGSMLSVTIAALAGRPMKVPPWIARTSFVLIGILLGAVVTPEMLKGIASWPLSIAILCVASLCMIAATTTYLRVVHRWQLMSALLGANPGSMAQVLALSAEFGADLRGIAIVQVMRVLLIVVGLPLGLALFGLTVEPLAVVGGAGDLKIGQLAILLIVSVASAYALLRLRFPGGLMFGALAGSAVLHGTGWIQVGLPWWAGSAAAVVLGAVAGSRFVNTSPRLLVSYLGAAVGSFVVAVAVAASFALIVVSILPIRIADVIVGFAPGAQDTMMVLALALHLDPIYVGAHHLARFLVVSITIAIAAKRVVRFEPKEPRERWRRPGQGAFDD